MRKHLAILCALAVSGPAGGLDMPSEWVFGTRADTEQISASFVVVNDEPQAVSLRVLSSCDCLTVKPGAFNLKPGERATIDMVLDPKGLYGPVSKLIMVKRETVGGSDRIFAVKGIVASRTPPPPEADDVECELCRKLSEEFRRQAYESWRQREGVVHYYYSPDCRTCTEFLEKEIPRVEKALGTRIDLDRQDIRGPVALEELDAVLAKRGLTVKAFPVLVLGESVLMGEKEIRAGFEAAVRRSAAAAKP